MMKDARVSNAVFRDIIAQLMWISRNTLDLDRLLDDDEYLEAARKILDYLGKDYVVAEAEYLKRKSGEVR